MRINKTCQCGTTLTTKNIKKLGTWLEYDYNLKVFWFNCKKCESTGVLKTKKYTYTKKQLIDQWLEKFPEDKNNLDLAETAVAGHVLLKNGLYIWASYHIPNKIMEKNENTKRKNV